MRLRTWDAAYIRGESLLELSDNCLGGWAYSVQTLNSVLVGDEFTLDISIGEKFIGGR